jgi:hypothetical protein
MRWDSDHVVIFNDELRNVFLEIQRGKAWDRVAIATDYFDASINRIGGLRHRPACYAEGDPLCPARPDGAVEETGSRR